MTFALEISNDYFFSRNSPPNPTIIHFHSRSLFMKRLSLLAVALVAISSLAFSQLKPGGMAVTTAIGPGGAIGGAYALSENMRLNAGVNFSSASNAGTSSTAFGIGAGVWMYQQAMENVTTFYGGGLTYGSSGPSGSTTSTFSVAGNFGAEYWFSPRFSWGGYVSAGFSSTSFAGTSSSNFGTMGVSTSLTWWLN
jgi:hypothetical protein